MVMKLPPPATTTGAQFALYGCFSVNIDNSSWIRQYETYLDIRICRLNWLTHKSGKGEKVIQRYMRIQNREYDRR